jgi:hypothetical protein
MKDKRRAELTLSDLATIYNCCGLFDMCADEDLVSLSLEGADAFLDWMGWERTNICVIKKEFIAYMRPEQSGDDCTEGYLGDPCASPSGVEWGKCDFTLEDFGRIRRHGPTRDVTENDERYCERQPRYRLDGTVITDDREYDARVISEVMLQDLRRYVVIGNAMTAGLFDGLQRLVRNGYTNANGTACQLMDSIVINWNSNPMGGGAGITWNGGAIAATWNLVDVLLDAMRVIRQRISWCPTLSAQPLTVGDIVLVLPNFAINCLLDHYTCWRVCDGSQYNEVALQSYEARQFRDKLNGGKYGYGRIFLNQFEIPLIGYDWGLINGPTTFDMYLLTGAVGAVKIIQGQYLDMTPVPSAYSEVGYTASDGGRFLHWVERDGTCVQQHQEFRPRMLLWAPWAQVRFQNVVCGTPSGPLTPDPCETSFFPLDSFSVAECP